ncbi:hypothetical protein DF122_03270 [Burkholderia pseudomallei]|nr:hypothetical protein BOC35_26070 [Burkholderia pseudomallei]KGR92831.1 LysM repeat [Burkholderia pseudomallei MSHR5608]KGS33071.1 LysM repeat [Burkholderia pseudomallei MSHR7343]KGX71116.1 LysM repeat [Burkholderia pseudomallei TSV28]ARL23999.1 hypothetical protein BOC47_17735 [Burkholderia pseudomallei]
MRAVRAKRHGGEIEPTRAWARRMLGRLTRLGWRIGRVAPSGSPAAHVALASDASHSGYVVAAPGGTRRRAICIHAHRRRVV